MELRQLRYFVKIVDLGSMSRAAGVLFIAQPALSQQVASLEAELGCKLLTRQARGVSATDSGHALYRHAVRVLKLIDEIPTLVRGPSNEPSGRVVIGIPVSVAKLIVTPLLQVASLQFPHITIAFNEAPSSYLPELLMAGHLDLALMFGGDELRGLVCASLFEEDLFLVEAASQEKEVAAHELVSVAELQGRRLALTAPQNSIRRLIDNACLAARVQYDLVTEISSPDRALDIAREGLAATILPWSALGVAREDMGFFIREIESPRLTRVVVLGENGEIGISEAAMAIRGLIVLVVNELVSRADCAAVRILGASNKAAD